MATKRTPKKSPRASRAERRKFALESRRSLARTEERYVAALRGIMRVITDTYERELEPMLEQIALKADGARADASNLSGTIDLVGVKVNASLPAAVGPAASTMAQGAVAASERVIGVRLKAMAGIPGISNAGKAGLLADIDRARDRNIRLVEDAHRAYAQSVRAIVDDPANFGLRVEEIKAKLVARGDVAAARAELIARDQTLKLTGQIAQTRMQRAGVNSYTWSTSGDERVRPEHAALEGQTFSWDSPPDVGHPGQDFQCRCVAVPVVEEAEGLFDTPETVA